jgi:transcriptional regulator GlxA family with amidase domain
MTEWLEQWKTDLQQDPTIQWDGELEQLLTMLDGQLDDPQLTVNELAARLHISRRQVHRDSKRLLDMTPGKLIKEARLRKAHWLLQHGQCETIGQVLRQIGLSTARYFEQQYEERYEVVPESLLTKQNEILVPPNKSHK